MSDGAHPQGPQAQVPTKVPANTLEGLIREKAPEILSSIPENKRPKLAAITIERSGPLPLPSELAAYDQIIPNGADRIMKMAEAQTVHRIEIEKIVIKSQQGQAWRGQVFGLIIGLAGLGLATLAAMNGQPWFGGIIGGATLVSLVSAFLYSQQKTKEDLSQKRQVDMQGAGNKKQKGVRR